MDNVSTGRRKGTRIEVLRATPTYTVSLLASDSVTSPKNRSERTDRLERLY